jgi:LysM repeat protein
LPDNVKIAPAEGKLGVLTPGVGAVTTTFIAGVEALKRGLGLPIGSLTQMATVRLGKRTDARTPKIKDFVPLADVNDLVFGGWDIFEDNAYEAATNAGVLENSLLSQLKEPLSAIQPMKGVFYPEFVKRLHGTVEHLPDPAEGESAGVQVNGDLVLLADHDLLLGVAGLFPFFLGELGGQVFDLLFVVLD